MPQYNVIIPPHL